MATTVVEVVVDVKVVVVDPVCVARTAVGDVGVGRIGCDVESGGFASCGVDGSCCGYDC